jgi:hypothetical protein
MDVSVTFDYKYTFKRNARKSVNSASTGLFIRVNQDGLVLKIIPMISGSD